MEGLGSPAHFWTWHRTTRWVDCSGLPRNPPQRIPEGSECDSQAYHRSQIDQTYFECKRMQIKSIQTYPAKWPVPNLDRHFRFFISPWEWQEIGIRLINSKLKPVVRYNWTICLTQHFTPSHTNRRRMQHLATTPPTHKTYAAPIGGGGKREPSVPALHCRVCETLVQHRHCNARHFTFLEPC